MGNKLKKIGINFLSSLSILISFILIFDYFSRWGDDILQYIVWVTLFSVSYFLLNRNSNSLLSIKVIKSVLISILFLLGFIYFDSTFNDYNITNYLLYLKGQEHYEGETRSRYLTTLFLSNIYPIILILNLLTFFLLLNRQKK